MGIYIVRRSRTESWFHIKSALRVCRLGVDTIEMEHQRKASMIGI